MFHAKVVVTTIKGFVCRSLSRYKSECFTPKWLSTPHGFGPYKSVFCFTYKSESVSSLSGCHKHAGLYVLVECAPHKMPAKNGMGDGQQLTLLFICP